MKSLNSRERQHSENEVKLAKDLLDQLWLSEEDRKRQRDRLAYHSLKLGDIETAREYGDSPKLSYMVDTASG